MRNTGWRNRIVAERDEPLADITFNPRNWRIHPKEQQAALAGAMREVGWVQRVIVNQRTGNLIDGHLRVMEADKAGETTVPAVIVDLSPEEEAYVLATIDPLSAMAATDAQQLDALLREVNSGEAAVQAMLADIARDAGIVPAVAAEADVSEGEADALAREWGVEQGDKWAIDDHVFYVGDSTGDQSALAGAPHQMVFDPPFDVDALRWSVPSGTNVVVVWGRGRRRLEWEAERFAGAEWGVHEIVFTGGVRGQMNKTLPCCLHDVVHVWRRQWWSDPTEAIDPEVIRASDCERTEDDRPRSVQQHCGGVLTGLMSWGKPLLAMEIAMAYSPRGSTIWDPCAGSGSSLIAAAKHGRCWVGVEGQERWAALILQRAKDAGMTPQRVDTQALAHYAGGDGGSGRASGQAGRARKATEGE